MREQQRRRDNGVVRVLRPYLWLGLGFCLAGGFVGCGGGQARSSTSASLTAREHSVANPACERNPRDGVHGPDRLRVLSPCVKFQGTVSEAPMKNPDGDVSLNASPDSGYAGMLNANNRREGGLHLEIVPRDQPGCTRGQPVVVSDVPGLGTCSGRGVIAPRLGAHVRVVGPWVLDRNNNWYEIHPVWSITVLHG
jgi:hypothetical protein